MLSPIQELEPGATPCRGGRCAARYPHGRQASLKQKYLDYDYVFPPMESNHRKAMPGAGEGLSKLG